MKKIILLITILIVSIGVAFFVNLNDDITTVNLNEEVSLKKYEKIKLENEDVYVSIKKFINSPPPDGFTPIWSGLAVIYQIEIDGDVYKTNDIGHLEEQNNLPYVVEILESDYKTFAKVKITENER